MASFAGTHDRGALVRLHLLMGIDKKVIEFVYANEAEARVFHICEGVQRDRQGSGENEHVYPATRFGGGHAKSSKQ